MVKLNPEVFLAGQLLLFNKPLHWTSFDVVNKVRFVLRKYTSNKKIKVGHAGTLDPLATGLLLVCTGKFTKRIDEFQGMPKSYRATILLGEETPSFDGETEVSKSYDISSISIDDVKKAMATFEGEIDQVPPIYSAIKKDGRKLYELAREGEDFKPASRRVNISKFELVENNWPKIVADVDCSKGTYIRSLAHDLGKSLNAGSYLTGLERTAIGDYSLDHAMEVEDFVKLYNRE
jgi:tRNA pseudouridine55 synthase